MLQAFMSEKWALRANLAVLFLSIALVVFTSNYLLLVLPVGFLFLQIVMLNWKMAFWILLFSIPFSIDIRLMGDTLGTSLPDEPIMWIFFLLFPIVWARNPNMFSKEHWWRNPIVFIIVVQYLWMIVTAIYSHEPILSVKFWLAKSWFLASFFFIPFFVFKEKKDFRTAFLVFLIPLVITMFIIFARHASEGFKFRKIEKAIGILYYNHVDYSTVLSMFLPLLFTAFALTKGRSIVTRGAVLVLIPIFMLTIYLTFARAAIVAVIFAAAVNLAIRIRLANLIMPVFYGAIGLLMVFMVNNNKYIEFRPNYERTYIHTSFAEHMIATFRGEDMSSMERLYRWIAAVRMSTDEPLKGYGPNTFYYHYKPYAVSSFKTYVSRNPEQSTTHNYFLYMLTEQGWPAMLLYAILIVVVIAQAQKIYHRFKDRFYKKVTLGVVMMFSAGFINNFFSELLETHKVGTLLYLCLALLVVLRKISIEKEREAQAEATTSAIPQP